MEIKRLNWIDKGGVWKQNQAWREKRAESRAKFEDQTAVAMNMFADAHANMIAGLSELAVRAATRRMQGDLQKKVAAALDKRA